MNAACRWMFSVLLNARRKIGSAALPRMESKFSGPSGLLPGAKASAISWTNSSVWPRFFRSFGLPSGVTLLYSTTCVICATFCLASFEENILLRFRIGWSISQLPVRITSGRKELRSRLRSSFMKNSIRLLAEPVATPCAVSRNARLEWRLFWLRD